MFVLISHAQNYYRKERGISVDKNLKAGSSHRKDSVVLDSVDGKPAV